MSYFKYYLINIRGNYEINDKMKKKLVLYLSGGLGNQLFQYFFGKSYAKNSDRELIIDNVSGFKTDFAFKRKYELPLIKNEKMKVRLFLFLFFRFLRKIFNVKHLRFFSNIFISEEKLFEDKNFFDDNALVKNIYIIGNFQNENYFKKSKFEILKNLDLNKVKNQDLIRKVKEFEVEKTVAIGVRLFEEMPGKSKINVGGVEEISFYNNSIEFFMKKIKNPKFVIFSTDHNSLLDKLDIKSNNVLFINSKTIKCKSTDKLLLMSSYKNFIISNSSFYWWAAYLSEMKFEKINIIASKKFYNKQTLPLRWNNNL